MLTTRIEIKTELSPALLIHKKEKSFEIESHDNDPYINITKTDQSKFKAGWYKFSFEFILKEGEIILPKIYFNFGNGYSENFHWKLFYENGKILGMVKIPWDCVSLRFDISEKNILFSQIEVELIRTRKLSAFIETIKLAQTLGMPYKNLLHEFLTFRNYKGIKKILKDISDGSYISPVYHSLESLSNASSGHHIPTFSELKNHSYINSKKIEAYFNKSLTGNTHNKLSEIALAHCVDILLPVYNGLSYLKILIPQILKYSDLDFRLYIINDASSDKGVNIFLDEIKLINSKNIIIDTNETNLGFTKTVNKLFEKSKNEYIILLNSDIELSENWISRLIYPFLNDEKIATITPMSNSATICSFPNIGDNELLDNTNTAELNNVLSGVPAFQEEIPTGVGFCMAIRKSALQKIGYFDEVNFPRGYGEEVDLCFRFNKIGLKNILNGSLFVYHKHGGSFDSVEKKQLQTANQKKIEELYPEFTTRLTSYFTNNSFVIHKAIYHLLLIKSKKKKVALFFDHDLGGGTNIYTKNYQAANSETIYLNITFPNPNINQENLLLLRTKFSNLHYHFTMESIGVLFSIFDNAGFVPDEIIINNLVSYSNIFDLLSTLTAYKTRNKHVALKFMGHDFYPICPNFLLLKNDEFCNIPDDLTTCAKCIENLSSTIEPVLTSKDFTTHIKWREQWGEFLHLCSEITVFTESTKKLFTKVWPSISEKVKIVPHVLVGFTKKINKPKNICVLGHIHSVAKGAKIIKELANELENNNPNNYNLISIGSIHPEFDSPFIQKKGPYSIETLYEKLMENRIDLILIPSVCSETFSFTTREAIESEIPAACFKLGGQYDQIKNYNKGVAIDSITTKSIISAFDKFFMVDVK